MFGQHFKDPNCVTDAEKADLSRQCKFSILKQLPEASRCQVWLCSILSRSTEITSWVRGEWGNLLYCDTDFPPKMFFFLVRGVWIMYQDLIVDDWRIFRRFVALDENSEDTDTEKWSKITTALIISRIDHQQVTSKRSAFNADWGDLTQVRSCKIELHYMANQTRYRDSQNNTHMYASVWTCGLWAGEPKTEYSCFIWRILRSFGRIKHLVFHKKKRFLKRLKNWFFYVKWRDLTTHAAKMSLNMLNSLVSALYCSDHTRTISKQEVRHAQL